MKLIQETFKLGIFVSLVLESQCLSPGHILFGKPFWIGITIYGVGGRGGNREGRGGELNCLYLVNTWKPVVVKMKEEVCVLKFSDWSSRTCPQVLSQASEGVLPYNPWSVLINILPLGCSIVNWVFFLFLSFVDRAPQEFMSWWMMRLASAIYIYTNTYIRYWSSLGSGLLQFVYIFVCLLMARFLFHPSDGEKLHRWGSFYSPVSNR